MERTQSNIRLFDRVLGSLIGFAIGDAMGVTTEFMTREEVQKKYGEVTTIMGGGWLNLEPGEVTDDTQMMLCVAKAYIAFRSGKTQDFMQSCCHQFCIWYNERPKDIGNTCNNVISTCMGLPKSDWIKYAEKLNQEHESLGNGSLMRCLFPAIVGDTEAAMGQGQLTHNNMTCDKYILLYCDAIAKALNATHASSKKVTRTRPNGDVESTFINTVAWSNEGSFKQAILGAVNDGGDADTIAALTGGLAGARFGFTRIPVEWVKKLNENTYNELRKMAETAISLIAERERL